MVSLREPTKVRGTRRRFSLCRGFTVTYMYMYLTDCKTVERTFDPCVVFLGDPLLGA